MEKEILIPARSSFEFILGKTEGDYSDAERRARWKAWQSVADAEVVEWWNTCEGCEGCRHLDKQALWCKLAGLPCSVNPVLSFRHGLIGMACMGAGYEQEPQQLTIFDL